MAISASAQLRLHEEPHLYDVVATIQDGQTELTYNAGFVDILFDKPGTSRAREMKIGGLTQDALQTLMDLHNCCVQMQPGETIEIEHGMFPIIMGKDENGLTFKWHKNDNLAHLTSSEIRQLYLSLKKYLDTERENPTVLP